MNFMLLWLRSKDRRIAKPAQGLVEFALIIPLFLMLLYGLFEVGRAVFMLSAVRNASRDAVRYAGASGTNPSGVERYRDCAGIRDRAKRVSAFVDLSAVNAVEISYDKGPSTPPISCEALVSSGKKLALGDRVVVTVRATFVPVVGPLLNFNTIPIESTSARSLVIGLDV